MSLIKVVLGGYVFPERAELTACWQLNTKAIITLLRSAMRGASEGPMRFESASGIF